MKEGDFLRSFRESIELVCPDAYFCKIPDSINTGFKGKYNRFTAPKPFDCFLVWKGVMYALELKIKKSAERLTISGMHHKTHKQTGGDIKTHQVDNLARVKRAGGKAAILVLYHFETPAEKVNQIFVLDPDKYNQVRDEYIAAGDKSIPYKDMVTRFNTVQRIKTDAGTHWDIQSLFVLMG